jgi:hypothetical protein
MVVPVFLLALFPLTNNSHPNRYLPAIRMLAIDAPPGQGKVHQPFVHYRCMCSSPGPSITATSKTPSSSSSAQEQLEQRCPSEQDLASTSEMNIDHPPASSTPSDALIVRASPFPHDPSSSSSTSSSDLHSHQQKPRSMEEIYASGNNSDEHGSLSLSRLYFCDSCDEIRCPKCTQDEIVCYYCPNCQFDVPTASVKSEKHK